LLEDAGGDVLCGGFVYLTPELKWLITRLLETRVCFREMGAAVGICAIVTNGTVVEILVLACAWEPNMANNDVWPGSSIAFTIPMARFTAAAMLQICDD
jgi:hypothetical protein